MSAIINLHRVVDLNSLLGGRRRRRWWGRSDETAMHRTGHPHACFINLSTFCCGGCWGARWNQRGALLLEWLCQIWKGLYFTLHNFNWAFPTSTSRRDVVALSVAKVDSSRKVRTPFVYHELFGCYVSTLWTLRTVCTNCSRFYQLLTGTTWANMKRFFPLQVSQELMRWM